MAARKEPKGEPLGSCCGEWPIGLPTEKVPGKGTKYVVREGKNVKDPHWRFVERGRRRKTVLLWEESSQTRRHQKYV